LFLEKETLMALVDFAALKQRVSIEQAAYQTCR
jgi:hypothetical protein